MNRDQISKFWSGQLWRGTEKAKESICPLTKLLAVEDGVVAALAGGEPVFDEAVAVNAVADRGCAARKLLLKGTEPEW